MSVFKKNGRYVSKFVLDGKQRWTPGGPWDTRRQALEAERRHRDKLNARRTDETCASFADRWVVEWRRPALGTRALYEQAAKRFADEFGPTPLGEVERMSARAWALGVPRNVSKIIGTMYEDARNIGLVNHNPFSNLRLPKTEKTEEITPPTRDEFRDLLGACLVHGGYAGEFRALITFAAWTGLRASEVQGIQWQDIGRDEIMVARARKDDGSYGLPKYQDKPEPIAFLEPAKVLDQVPRREGSPFVFHTPRGLPLNKSNLYYLWNKVRDTSGTSMERLSAGLQPIRFHDLRHACATWLLEEGMSHFDVSVQLRHKDNGILVAQRYGHPSRDAARERLLGAFAPKRPEIGRPSTAAEGWRR